MATFIPRLTRRDFIRAGAVSVGGYYLRPVVQAASINAKEKAQPRGGAEICIMLFLQGGPSQLDTFDIKEGPWTPEDLDVRTVTPGVRMPVGLLPKLSERLDKYAIVRSMEAWEAEHSRGIYYMQAGRILSPARIHEIPSVGSVIAYELLEKRTRSDYLPPFVSMNMDTSQLVGSGLLPSTTAPMATFSDSPAPFVMSEQERSTFERRQQLLRTLDSRWREMDSHRGRIFRDIDDHYQSAYPMLSNPKASKIFTVPEEEKQRYGSSSLGDACIMARNIVEADAGTKFIFISHDGWDLHIRAFDKNAKTNQYTMCWQLDGALSALLDDLESRTDESGRSLIDKTLIISLGEFGRTPADLTLRAGRDHYRFAAVGLFAGAGVRGGQIIGGTDDEGGTVVDPGWHKSRSIYPEDVLVTLYSAMGIDWTKKITQTPSGRAFEYIENISPKGYLTFAEVKELFHS